MLQRNHETDTEGRIVTLMKDRRPEGMKLLMDTYQSRLYWHLRRLIPDHATCQDVLQDVFVKVFERFDQFNAQSKLYTWLYRIAANEALQLLAKQKRQFGVMSDAVTELQNMVAEEAAPDAELIHVLLHKALHELPEKQRLVFTLRYYDDLSYEDIAQITSASIGSLKTNYHYAKEKIEKYIRTHYEGH